MWKELRAIKVWISQLIVDNASTRDSFPRYKGTLCFLRQASIALKLFLRGAFALKFQHLIELKTNPCLWNRTARRLFVCMCVCETFEINSFRSLLSVGILLLIWIAQVFC